MSYHTVKTRIYCCQSQERNWYNGLVHDANCKEHKGGSSPEQIEHDAMQSGYYENGGIADDIKKLIQKNK